MSTYFASSRVNGPDHLLDGRLGGYCGDRIPRVHQAVCYNPKNLDRVGFPPIANGWETKYLVLDMAPPLLVEEEGPPT
jgi:hypothetical protein